MKKRLSHQPFVAIAVAVALCGAAATSAQVAGGTTTVDTNATESTHTAMGWSVKKTLLGKAIYNDAGKKVGKVADLIISPDNDVSYIIVGTGGFVGIGRHDVAIPITQIQNKADRLVMAGATQELIEAMPEFVYATTPAAGDTQREAFVTAAGQDIAKGRTMVANLEKKAGSAASDAKAKLDLQTTALQMDVKSAESKLDALKQATPAHWRSFEADVSAATARLRKSIQLATD